MLVPFTQDVYTDTRPAKFFGVECGSRMTVVRLATGGLFVHSPVALRRRDASSGGCPGRGARRRGPSLFHHLHVRPWMTAYPRAHFAACPGLEWKRSDLEWSSVLGDVPHPIWAGEVDQVYFSARRENEVDFYLPRHKVLICADALLNISTIPALTSQVASRLMGNHAPGIGWMEYLMIRDRKLARRQVERILAWDFSSESSRARLDDRA